MANRWTPEKIPGPQSINWKKVPGGLTVDVKFPSDLDNSFSIHYQWHTAKNVFAYGEAPINKGGFTLIKPGDIWMYNILSQKYGFSILLKNGPRPPLPTQPYKRKRKKKPHTRKFFERANVPGPDLSRKGKISRVGESPDCAAQRWGMGRKIFKGFLFAIVRRLKMGGKPLKAMPSKNLKLRKGENNENNMSPCFFAPST